ncbi:MAG: hypothetical protein GEU80_08705 [Dehalococcoidia bacterium]|nr:hypothetical protein [Dehalococcoidia bacterium]
MELELPPLTDVLGRLPWYRDLSANHRGEMLTEIRGRLVTRTSRDEFAHLLERWSSVAHSDAKWARLRLLHESGMLSPGEFLT